MFSVVAKKYQRLQLPHPMTVKLQYITFSSLGLDFPLIQLYVLVSSTFRNSWLLQWSTRRLTHMKFHTAVHVCLYWTGPLVAKVGSGLVPTDHKTAVFASPLF